MEAQIQSRSIKSRGFEIVVWGLGGLLFAAIVGTMNPLAAYGVGAICAVGSAAILSGRVSIPQLRKARAFGLIWVAFVMISGTVGYQAQLAEDQRVASELATLRETDPDAYLARLQQQDEAIWLQELEILRPNQFEAEIERRQQEVADLEGAQQRERDRIEREREIARTEARAAAEIAELEEAQSQFENALLTASVAVTEPFNAPGTLRDVAQYLNRIDLLAAPFILAEDQQLNPDQASELEALRREVVQFQTRTFPSVRDAFGPIFRRELWIDDGTARTSGGDFKVIEIVKPEFALNRQIVSFNEEHFDVLVRLRFTSAEYRALPGGPARQVFDFDRFSAGDGEIVGWRNGQAFRPAPPGQSEPEANQASERHSIARGVLGQWLVDRPSA